MQLKSYIAVLPVVLTKAVAVIVHTDTIPISHVDLTVTVVVYPVLTILASTRIYQGVRIITIYLPLAMELASIGVFIEVRAYFPFEEAVRIKIKGAASRVVASPPIPSFRE